MKKAERIFESLGTICRITIFADPDDAYALRFLDYAENYIRKLDDLFSIFKEDSEISKLNRSAGERPVDLSEETVSVLVIADECKELTNGAFDVMAASGGKSVDLGGIAKGFAADRLREMMREAGISDALIDLGGTVLSLGKEREIGIRDPFRPVGGKAADGTETDRNGQKTEPEKGGTVMTVRSRDEVICTSGIYEQGEHIIDPGTGKPAKTNVLSVTVIGKDGAQADALATAAVVLGVRDSMEILGQADCEAVFILKGGNVFATEGLKDRVTMTGR